MMKYIQILGKHFDKFTTVSDEDYSNLSKKKWYIGTTGYPTDGKTCIHNLILPKVKGREIEHRDGNKLNNQRENLRYATRSQNHANRRKLENTLSEFKGVGFRNDVFRNKPWRATIWKNYKQYRLGDFKTEDEAALAYNRKAFEFYGEFAKLNDV